MKHQQRRQRQRRKVIFMKQQQRRANSKSKEELTERALNQFTKYGVKKQLLKTAPPPKT